MGLNARAPRRPKGEARGALRLPAGANYTLAVMGFGRAPDLVFLTPIGTISSHARALRATFLIAIAARRKRHPSSRDGESGPLVFGHVSPIGTMAKLAPWRADLYRFDSKNSQRGLSHGRLAAALGAVAIERACAGAPSRWEGRGKTRVTV